MILRISEGFVRQPPTNAMVGLDTTAPSSCARNTIARRPSGSASDSFHGNVRDDDRRSVLVLEPAAPPDPPGPAYAVSRARSKWSLSSRRFRRAAASRRRLRSRRRSEPAPGLRCRPRRTTDRRGERSSARRPAPLSTRRTAFSDSVPTQWRRETKSAFPIRGNRSWPHCGPMEHPDRADPPAARS